MVLIGEPDEIDTSDGLHRLRRWGYRPVESFAVLETDFEGLNGVSPRLRSVLDQVIRTAQAGGVEEILLAIRWDQRRLVDSIVTALRVVPIPIRLAPDRTIAELLHKPKTEIGSTWVVDLHRGQLTWSECAVKRGVRYYIFQLGAYHASANHADSRYHDKAQLVRTCSFLAGSQRL